MFSGWLTMNDRCSACGHRFLREEGFFQGAMYVSYVAGLVEFAVIALALVKLLGSRVGIVGALAVAIVVHLMLVPQLFQYSRVIWAHVNAGTGATVDDSVREE